MGVADHLGSGSLMRDGDGDTRVQWYTPFGAVRAASLESGLVVDEGFTGQTADVGVGLIDFNARAYDPQLGRFIMGDTISPQGGVVSQNLNRYSYVRNNPVKYVDPSGHLPGQGQATRAEWHRALGIKYYPDPAVRAALQAMKDEEQIVWLSESGHDGVDSGPCLTSADCESFISTWTNGAICSRLPVLGDTNCDSGESAREHMDEVNLGAGTVAFWCARFAVMPCAYSAGTIEVAAGISNVSLNCARPAGLTDSGACDAATLTMANTAAGLPALGMPGPAGAVWDGFTTWTGWLTTADSMSSSPGGCSTRYDAPPSESGYRGCN